MKKIVSPLHLFSSISNLNLRTTAITVALITLLFSGCALGPDFTSPPSPDTKSYTTGKQSNRHYYNIFGDRCSPDFSTGERYSRTVVDTISLSGIDQIDRTGNEA